MDTEAQKEQAIEKLITEILEAIELSLYRQGVSREIVQVAFIEGAKAMSRIALAHGIDPKVLFEDAVAPTANEEQQS